MYKKFLLKIIIFIAMIFVTTNVSALQYSEDGSYTNSRGVRMTQSQVERLINLGFSDMEIQNMVESIFEENKDLEGRVVAETIKYYKTETYIQNNIMTYSNVGNIPISKTIEITKEVYDNAKSLDNSINPLDLSTNVVITDYKSMTTTIIEVNGRYRYKNSVIWKEIPFWRTLEIIGIGIEENKVYPISSTAKFTGNYASGGGTTTSGTWTKSPTGYALQFKWPKAGDGNFYATLYFEVDKQDVSKKITVLNAYGDYKHLKGFNVNGSVGVGVDVKGISISGSIASSFDSMSTSQATLTGINW